MNSKSRTRNSVYGMSSAVGYYIVNIVMGLANRKVLISMMGIDYQGINGLFASILTVLGVAELGIGTAIIYNLYRPIANNDIVSITSIMHFYKKCYTWIAVGMSIVGAVISFKLDFFVQETSIPVNLQVIFLLVLADIIATYTFAYKRSILFADQRNYIVSIINTIFVLCINVTQIAILFYTHNYYYYLCSKFVFRLIENIVINIIVNNLYPFLCGKDILPISKDILQDIKIKVKGLLFHKIGTFLVVGTDNILISKFISLSVVGIYSNYFYVISSVNAILQHAFDSITGSVGNLITSLEEEKKMKVFKELNLLNILFSSVCVNLVFVLTTPFIEIVFGNKFTLSTEIMFALIINMVLTTQRLVFGIFKTAAGIQYEDRLVPLFEAAINLICSLLLLHWLGLIGIFMGTTVSLFTQYGYSFPKFIFKRVLNGTYSQYVKYVLSVFLFYLLSSSSIYLSTYWIKGNTYIIFIEKLFVTSIMSVLVFIVCYHKSQSFSYIMQRLNKIKKK